MPQDTSRGAIRAWSISRRLPDLQARSCCRERAGGHVRGEPLFAEQNAQHRSKDASTALVACAQNVLRLSEGPALTRGETPRQLLLGSPCCALRAIRGSA